jgi:hypothetical protein
MKRSLALVLAAVACGGNDVVAPIQAACHATTQPLTLSVGADSAVDPGPTSGCVIFAANASTTDFAEYLLVPQVAATGPDFRSSFRLSGGAPIVAAPPVAAQLEAAASPALEFHNALRLMEQYRSYPQVTGPAARSGLALSTVPRAPSVGDRRTFKVISNITGIPAPILVGAIAQSVGGHVAIYVDSTAPANGLTTADLDSLRDAFNQNLYPADVAAFGNESDIDNNGLVVVLMTNAINKLVTAQQCVTTGYVAGFFFGADIDPVTHSQWNNGEIFYTVVADSSGTLSCPHTNTGVKRVVPVTFIHEFQHMISYNQHVLMRGGGGEVLWLNEGMSHYAEELGGRVYLQIGDSVRFCDGVRGDLYNFGQYLMNPGAYPLVDTSGIGGLGGGGGGGGGGGRRLLGLRPVPGGSVRGGHEYRGREHIHQADRPDIGDGDRQRRSADWGAVRDPRAAVGARELGIRSARLHRPRHHEVQALGVPHRFPGVVRAVRPRGWPGRVPAHGARGSGRRYPCDRHHVRGVGGHVPECVAAAGRRAVHPALQ